MRERRGRGREGLESTFKGREVKGEKGRGGGKGEGRRESLSPLKLYFE